METERPPAPASFSSSSAEVQVRVDSGTAHNNAIHPVNIDTPQLAFPCPVAYREVKHLKKWKPWLIYGIVVANVVVFIITMYVNNCPKNSVSCIARFLGRFSFEPFRENPLLGPSATTLLNMGALQVILVLDGHQAWRLVTCNWLHAGVFHILANMLGLVIIGIRLEQEFGFVKIGLVYVISGFGGSLLSALFIQSGISVGASGALFGLLGALLSELIINWSIYSGKVSAFILLLIMIVTNLAMGILPHVDNFAHIGGFLSGFLLGFVFLIRPQFGWYTQRYTPTEYTSASVVPKFKLYQCILWIISVVFLVAGYTVGLLMLLRGVNANDHCSWCHYLSCVPTAKWSCNQTASCMSNQIGNQLNITCTANGRSGVYELPNTTSRQMRVICAQLCS